MSSCISSPGDGAFLLSEERELKRFNGCLGPKSESYCRFSILVKLIALVDIAKPQSSTTLELRVLFESHKN